MKAKIFIVSQDQDVAKLINDTLQGEGHKVTPSDLPITAAKKCQAEKFDLTFVDVHIREMPYNKLITDIKKYSPETEIVVVTTYAFPESIEKGAALDIAGYLIKPLTADKIKNVTNRALRQGELARENRRLLLAVTAAKKEWEATVDAIEDPIFVTDFDYNILRANLATFRRLGKGVSEVIGHKCYELLHCSKHVLEDCPGKRARDTGEPASETMSFKGLKKRMSCSVYPQVFASGGGLVHYLREPAVSTEQQAETLTKYERLFDDAILPVILVGSEDYKVIDANQRAIELFGYDPEKIFDMDLENLFAQSLRETAINNIVNQLEKKEAPLKTKVLIHNKEERDAFVVANTIEIGNISSVEIFIIPVELLSSSREL
jgi:PAS domain S-box-containing protein